ncbi:MAG: hypothetical protein ACJATI_005043 [Halioglobus sp.]|jgi:hypothetical protein
MIGFSESVGRTSPKALPGFILILCVLVISAIFIVGFAIVDEKEAKIPSNILPIDDKKSNPS